MRAVLPLLAALALLAAPAARADCNLTLSVYNSGNHPVSVRVNDVEVRSRTGIAGVLQAWGPWRRAARGGWFDDRTRLDIAPGTSARDAFVGDFACSDHRQLRVTYRCEGGPQSGSSHTRTNAPPVSSTNNYTIHAGERC